LTETRATLRAEHDRLAARLHRRSEDFDASERLRLVIAALQRLPYPAPTVGIANGRRKSRKRRG